MCVFLYVAMCTSMQVPVKVRGVRPGARVTSSCQTPNMDAGNLLGPLEKECDLLTAELSLALASRLNK